MIPAGATALLPAPQTAPADSRIIPISNHFDSGPIRENPLSYCRNNLAPYSSSLTGCGRWRWQRNARTNRGATP